LYNGVNLVYAQASPVITVAEPLIEGQVDVYVTFYLNNVIDTWGGASMERTPTVSTSGQITASTGSIGAFSRVTTILFPSLQTVDANLHIYKSTYVPSVDFFGNVNFSIASSGVFSYSWLDYIEYVYNGMTGSGYWRTATRTVNISSGDFETVAVDTEFRYELNSANGIYEVNEGDSLAFDFDTVHLTNPNSLSYQIYKINSVESVDEDFDGSTSGGLTFINGRAVINAQLSADNFSEGTETFAIGIYDSQQNQLTFKVFDVIDTSLTPPDAPTLALQSDTGLSAGDSITSSSVIHLGVLVDKGFWE
jgi:hypothetical protein